MKNKIWKKEDEFRQFKSHIFFRTIWMVILAAVCIHLLYFLFLKGNFANWIVAAYQNLLGLDYDTAKTLYTKTFRNYMEWFFAVGAVFLFFVMFRIYLNRFIYYFVEINRGIDRIGREGAEEVSMPQELSVTEKKINSIKHTLEKQKLDMKLAERQKNDMVMYLAHDLKTPLASVIGYLNLLRDEEQISEELRQKYLTVTLDKAERLEDLINEFFEIAKFNLSNITLQYSRISLERLLEMLLYEFQPMLQEKHLHCRLVIPEEFMLRCDPDKMQRVFDNILKNAVLYSFEGTGIVIEAVSRDGNAEITFLNHGDTIPAEKLERIFEQFYRLDTSRSTSGAGAGLGLAVARQIVELHGGTITAESKEERTEFKVILPVS